MATSKEFLDYILDSLSSLDGISAKKMMGEYIIYYHGKIAAYLCDNRMLIKDVPSARALLPNADPEPPYEGARDMLLFEDTDNKAFLKELFEAIYPELPEPKAKKKK